MKVYISTNGCVEGQLSSTFIEQFFIKNKSTVINDPTQADLLVFYACGLTEQKEKDSLIIIRKLKVLMKPSARLLVWGCLPKINPQSLRAIYDGPLIGPMDTNFFEGIFEKTMIPSDNMEWARAANMLIPSQTSGLYNYHHTDALTSAIFLLKQDWDRLWARARKNTLFFIRVSQGCTGHCTYCSERCAFGRIKSRPIKNIISEFKWGLQQGYNRFSLVATDLGAYGLDMGCTLFDLLEKMIEINSKRNYRIVLNQVNAFYLKKCFSDLEQILASGKIETLCCPVQSGSNRILKLMGRMHTAEEWREYMININIKFPHIRLGTQLMVGFPTETGEDFRATLKLLDYPLFLDFIYVFRFSKRPAVPAARIRGQISEKVKELRYKRLLRKHALTHIFNAANRCMRGRFSELAK